LVASATKFETDKIVIEMHDSLDIFDLAAEVAGAKSISRKGDACWGCIERRPGRLSRGNRDKDQKRQADQNYFACGVKKGS